MYQWLLTIIGASVAFATPVITFANSHYQGIWSGGAHASLEIMSEMPLIVTYCFQSDCHLYEPSGTIDDMTFVFKARGDFPGATMTMQKKGTDYEGNFQQTGSAEVYTATLTK